MNVGTVNHNHPRRSNCFMGPEPSRRTIGNYSGARGPIQPQITVRPVEHGEVAQSWAERALISFGPEPLRGCAYLRGIAGDPVDPKPGGE
jgi:hypothetical protein